METRRPHSTYSQVAAPPPPPSAVDARPPAHNFSSQHSHPPPPASQHQQHQQHHSGSSATSLPPLQTSQHSQPPSSSYGAQDPPKLPPLNNHHTAPPPHDPREGPDYQQQQQHQHQHQQYNSHNRSGHVTPAPVNHRSYSHDSSHQRTPTTPYPPGSSEGPPPPPHQPQHPMDHAVHGYPPSNGIPHHGLPPPPIPGPPPPHLEHPPHYMPTPMMENHHGYGPSTPMYSQHSYGPASTALMQTQQKRKTMRATQACEQCRQRKQKCDEGTPCSFCKENNLQCLYRDTPPVKTDKNMERLLAYMDHQSEAMRDLREVVKGMSEKVRHIEATQCHTAQDSANNASYSTYSTPQIGAHQPRSDHQEQVDGYQQRGKPALGDHRTAPHKLLMLWPTVQELLQSAGFENNEDYVMKAEERGVLRMCARGEGVDDGDGTQPGGPASPARSEESGDVVTAPTPPEGVWGVGLPQTPNGNARRSDNYSAGGLKPDGSLDLDAQTILTLYDSYIRHFHIMHPFVNKDRLRKMVDTFIKRYSSSQMRNRQQTFAVQNNDGERPLKRQRSNGSTANESANTYSSLVPERSPSNALIYLVLALGKIGLHKTPLPGPVPENALVANATVRHGLQGGSPMGPTIKAPPTSPGMTPITHPTPPFFDQSQSRSRRSSMDGHFLAGNRNVDVIPGLAYYTKAAEILGDQADGHDVVHAQMFLLAGLYKGQLARVKESLSWFTMAGRVLQMLLDHHKLFNHNYWKDEGDITMRLERGQAVIKNMRLNLIVIASWSCLQLESDILAELKLPASNLPDYEDKLLFPKRMPEEETYGGLDPEVQDKDGSNIPVEDVINLFYMGQLYLRRRLNKVHRELYGSECYHMTLASVRETLVQHNSALEGWRRALPSNIKWNDGDPTPVDILQARLRAKYYGARYIINRPFLDYFLHILPGVKQGQKARDCARDVKGQSRHPEEIHIFEAIERMDEKEITDACVRCVKAAMHSTEAFDNVPGRPIITNIHGTAHAQFGNVLVLSATYFSLQRNPYAYLASELVPRERLRFLLQRTITFLRKLIPISPTSNMDCMILERIQRRIFGVLDDESHYQNQAVEANVHDA